MLSVWTFDNEELPLTAELVQEDVLLRFLAGLKSKHVDEVVVIGVAFSGASTDVPELVLRPTVISTLTNAPIAVANNSGWTSIHRSLSHRKLLADGMVRFTLASEDTLRLVCNLGARKAWMAQAWSVFDARGISLEEDLSVYRVSLFSTPLLSTNIFQTFSSLAPHCLAAFHTLKPVDNSKNQSIFLFDHFLSTWTMATPLLFISGPLMKTASLRSHTTSASTLAFQQRSESLNSPTHTFGQMMHTTPYANISYSEGLTLPPLISHNLLDMTKTFTKLRATQINLRRLIKVQIIHLLPLPLSDLLRVLLAEPPFKDGASTSAAQISALEDPTTTHPAQKSSEPTTSSNRRTSLSTPSAAETAVKYDAEPKSTARLSTETEGPSTHWAKPGFLKKWCMYYVSSVPVYIEVLMHNLQMIWCRRLLRAWMI
ncbi:hypothetical protein PQX77_019627 [Marasmius sp. AFHP31]|nr:hypothetical protein PQX77_019627 [Marasmius sp. AFHP31]